MKRNVVIAGATGLVGSQILTGLLDDAEVERVYVLARRAIARSHSKLTLLEVDFSQLPVLPPVDEVYLALGTTIKAAGSQSAFRRVDCDYNLAVAQAAIAAGATRIGLVSSLGANAKSKNFYTRVKGELENALEQLKPHSLVIVRPSALTGNREVLGQPTRTSEVITLTIAQCFMPIIPKAFRPISACKVATALRAVLPHAHGVTILTSAQVHDY
jgi:uncharacterized protein YbjT (DUF2867 family)